MPYKLALLAFAMAVIPSLYVNVWLGLAAGVIAYALAAKIANRDMDRVFLISSLKTKPKPKL